MRLQPLSVPPQANVRQSNYLKLLARPKRFELLPPRFAVWAMNRLRMERFSHTLEAARSELKRIERELDTLLNLILRGGAADRINAKIVQLECRRAELERQLADAQMPRPCFIPRWRRSTVNK